MLCPSCGAEVGDKIQLCAQCEEARLERMRAESQSKAPRSPVSETHQQVNTRTEADREPPDDEDGSRRRQKFVVLLLLLLAICIVLAVIIAFIAQSPTPGPQPITPQPSGQTSPAGAVTTFRSAIRFGDTQIRFQSGLALYRPAFRELEIGFFRTQPEKAAVIEAVKNASLKAVNGVRPDLLLTIRFRRANRSCAKEGIESFRAQLYKNEDGLPLAGDEVSFELAAQGDTENGPKSFSLNSLVCELKAGSQVQGSLKGSRTSAVRDESVTAAWELEFSLPLFFPPPMEVAYRSDSAASTVALWDQKKSELSIGYFADELLGPEREEMRSARSLLGLLRYQPDVVVTIAVDKAQKYLAPHAVRTYGITFYRGRGAKLNFPGESDAVNLFFVASAEGEKRLTGLSGALGEGGAAVGSFHGELKRKLEDAETYFRWDLNFNVPIIDIDALGPPRGGSSAPESESVNGAQGKITADGMTAEIRAVMVVYYPEINDVGIGLYAEPLSEQERAEIASKKVLSTFVNNKRPMMVLLLDFVRNSKEFTADTLAAYTVYFYRNEGGFTFPGQHDAVSFRRSKEQFSKQEFRQLTGAARPGSRLSVAMNSSGQSTSGAKFSWDFKLSESMVPVR